MFYAKIQAENPFLNFIAAENLTDEKRIYIFC